MNSRLSASLLLVGDKWWVAQYSTRYTGLWGKVFKHTTNRQDRRGRRVAQMQNEMKSCARSVLSCPILPHPVMIAAISAIAKMSDPCTLPPKIREKSVRARARGESCSCACQALSIISRLNRRKSPLSLLPPPQPAHTMTIDKELPPTPKKSWLPFSLSIFALLPWTFNKDARFFGIPKKTLIVLAAAVALVFLALLLGLSIGLTIGRKNSCAPALYLS